MAERDEQDTAEATDPDVLPRYDDAADALDYPPDRPMGVDAYGTTAAEEHVGEPLEERVAREDDERDGFAGTAEPDIEVLLDIEAEEEEALLAAPDEVGAAVGRLGMDGPDDDVPVDHGVESDVMAWAADASDLSAEEDAMHITSE